MNEKVSISDINIPNNFKDIKTNYRITLYDKDTGEVVYSTDGHNRINPNISLRAWSMTYGTMTTNYLDLLPTNYTSYEIPSGIYFYNSTDDPSTNHIAGPQIGTFIGGGQLGVSNSAANRCSYNPTESKFEIIYEDGIAYKHNHIVMDATTSQMNGEINTVVLGANKYLSCNGVFEAGLYVHTPNNYSGGTLSDYHKPQYGKNASLMSYHPDKPTWLNYATSDSSAPGSWSFESDNTAWYSPHRRSGIANVDDIVLFHFDLKTWKVLETIKLSLPQECIGTQCFAFKLDNRIGLYRYNAYSYSESSGNPSYGSNNLYIFNLNGDFVKSVGRSLNSFTPFTCIAIDGKIYQAPMTSNVSLRSLLVFDAELNLLDGIRMKDYMDDSRFGYNSSYGKYTYYAKPICILDNITGDRKLLIGGCAEFNTNTSGLTNLVWDTKTGQVEWLPENSIYAHCYGGGVFNTSYITPCVIDGIGYTLPTENGGTIYWPRLWHHWCKLPSPVTKTANTTMKIQIDIYYPIVSPFAFAAPPDTEEPTTES